MDHAHRCEQLYFVMAGFKPATLQTESATAIQTDYINSYNYRIRIKKETAK